jgi:hypothetical protein
MTFGSGGCVEIGGRRPLGGKMRRRKEVVDIVVVVLKGEILSRRLTYPSSLIVVKGIAPSPSISNSGHPPG